MQDYNSEVVRVFKNITENIVCDNFCKTKILEMSINISEFARKFEAFQVDTNGTEENANFNLNYEISFKKKIKEWHEKTSIGSNKWNKVRFYSYQDGTFEYKTWWDEQFYQDVYGEPSGLSL